MAFRALNPEEAKAVAALHRLAKIWPDSLKLFSWSGSLVVMDAGMEAGEAAVLDHVSGIVNDGGDPG